MFCCRISCSGRSVGSVGIPKPPPAHPCGRVPTQIPCPQILPRAVPARSHQSSGKGEGQGQPQEGFPSSSSWIFPESVTSSSPPTRPRCPQTGPGVAGATLGLPTNPKAAPSHFSTAPPQFSSWSSCSSSSTDRPCSSRSFPASPEPQLPTFPPFTSEYLSCHPNPSLHLPAQLKFRLFPHPST